MTKASDELREKWGGRGGFGEEKAMGFLYSRGYRLTHGWEWEKPAPEHVVSDDEAEAIQFLFEEWDFGGIVDEQGK